MSVIPATQEAEIAGLWFEASLDKKVSKTLCQKPEMVVHVCNPSYLGGRNRRVVVPGQSGPEVSETLSEK
jgi:hypothetical protein